jgi:serine/threonine protein kinase
MAPELASGHAERAADLYALGMAVRHLWPDGAPSDLAAAAATLTDPDPRKRSITARQLADIAVADRLPPPPAPTTPGAGAVFGSRWLLQEKLGGGASGTVWKAIDTNFDKTVALKIYDRVDAGDEVQREYLALEDLSHPGIVRIRDGQRVDGKWVLVSEFLDGATLRAAMPPATEPLSWDTAASITMKLLSALQAVHPDMPRILELSARDDLTDDEQIELAKLRSKGVVHRDVKPENVVLVAERGPVLVDFGLAAAGPSGAPGGTPQYRPPGIAFEGSNPDLDLFAVGVMLHEMLTGTHPFTDSDPIGGTLQVARGLDPAVRSLLERACSPVDADRFHSAQEFIAALAVLGVAEVPMPVPPPHATELVAEIRRAVAEQRWDDAERLCPADWDQVRRQIADRRALAAGAEETKPLLEIDGYSLTFTGTRRFDNAKNTANVDVGPGTSRVYLVRGPGSVMFEVLDHLADSGERWVQGGDVFQSPLPFSRLGHGLRMGTLPLGDQIRIQLNQGRIINSEGWSNTFKAAVEELDAGAGVGVEDTLRRFGATAFGTQAEVFDDTGARRNYVCTTSDPTNEDLPAVAYFVTRVMPLAHGVQAG